MEQSCSVEGCDEPGAVRVTGEYPLPGHEKPLNVETLICLEHARAIGRGSYS